MAGPRRGSDRALTPSDGPNMSQAGRHPPSCRCRTSVPELRPPRDRAFINHDAQSRRLRQAKFTLHYGPVRDDYAAPRESGSGRGRLAGFGCEWPRRIRDPRGGKSRVGGIRIRDLSVPNASQYRRPTCAFRKIVPLSRSFVSPLLSKHDRDRPRYAHDRARIAHAGGRSVPHSGR